MVLLLSWYYWWQWLAFPFPTSPSTHTVGHSEYDLCLNAVDEIIKFQVLLSQGPLDTYTKYALWVCGYTIKLN